MADGSTRRLTASEFLAKVVTLAKAAAQQVGYDTRLLDEVVEEYQDQLLAFIRQAYAAKLAPERIVLPSGLAENWTPKQRALANLRAMNVLADRPVETVTNDERELLRAYSGWGGVGSIEKYAAQFPKAFPVPDARGLLHEYYTPTRVWAEVVAMVQRLVRQGWQLPRAEDGKVHALEPSAGIGRAIAAAEDMDLAWTALELQETSVMLLRALYPKAEIIGPGPAERWIARNVGRRRFGLILANPPYGARGEALELDSEAYATKQAYIYFLIRTAELLEKDGIGVYIIPTGFMSSKIPQFVRHRQAFLRRAHLLGAFRLPSQPPEGGTSADVAYDNFVVDVVVAAGRGGIAPQTLPSDLGVLEGRYFEETPTHVLGKPVGALAEGEDTPGPKIRRGFQIVGRFTGFPAWTPRPMEETEVVAGKAAEKIRGGIARERMEELPDDAPENLRAAVSLGIRADAHLAAVARGDAAKAGGGAELRRDLEAWRAAFGPPRDDASLAVLAETSVAIQRFMSLWEKDGSLTDLLEKDVQRAGYQGPLHLGSYADWLYRQTGGLPLPISKLSEEAERQGLGPVDTERVKSELWPLGWRIDNAARLEGYTSIEPKEAYLTGDLWPKHDRAKALAEQGDELAKDALSELRAAIGWTGGQAVLAQSSPNQPWIPLDILVRFARKHSEWPTYTDFARKDGLLLPDDGSEYGRLDNTDKSRTRGFSRNALCFIGWCNNDKSLFRPEGRKEDNGDGTTRNVPASELRKEMEEAWNKKWNEWLRSDDTVANALELAYNRRLRGYVPRTYSSEPMELARWGPKVRLHSYQNAGVRQLVENRCGLLALDVGLGKTFTGIATLAAARQQGWARRPVILSPNTICWSWYRQILLCLPDYRIVVIGANRKKVSKVTGRAISDEEAAAVGIKGWRWRSTLDTPEQRAKKWTAFQAGLYDVAICTYTAFSRQQIDPGFVQKYVGKNVAIRRAITLSLDQAEEGEEKKPQKRTERSEADTQERVRAWVGAQLSPPKGWSYDPGIDWHSLGVDLLIVDEAQNFKNLYYSSRESSSDAQASKRAWALDFRCASVREYSGGAGVVLLSATPMKNAATEFYNLLHLVNPAIWDQVGIQDPEGFINQFASIRSMEVATGDGKRESRDVVTGFNHLDALKGVVYRWSSFKTAAQVGLKIPDVSRVMHVVRASSAQQELFAKLFAELVEVQESITKAFQAAQGASNKQKSENIMRALRQKKQGIHMKLYMASVHPGLVDQVGGPAVDGPKLVACAKAILSTRAYVCRTSDLWGRKDEEEGDFCLKCGHVVFADNVAVHYWLRELLVAGFPPDADHPNGLPGLPAERIAILNAKEVPDLEQRAQIAEAFNGVGEPADQDYEAPKFDVVIANAVAYEGINLQRHTCALHHIDVPWEPATLQQRNGRGVRQGNRFDEVNIHFYFVEGSSEKHRLDKIQRKRGIMASLFEEGAGTTNSVEADSVEADDDIADAFGEYCPPALRERMAANKAVEESAKQAESDARARKAANRVLRDLVAAIGRVVRLSTTAASPERDLRLEAALAERSELEARVKVFPARLWPYDWHKIAAGALDQERVLIPDDGPALYAGVRLEASDQEAVGDRMWALVTRVEDQGVWFLPKGRSPVLLKIGEAVTIDRVVGNVSRVEVISPDEEWFRRAGYKLEVPATVYDFEEGQFHGWGPWIDDYLWHRVVTVSKGGTWRFARPAITDGRLVLDKAWTALSPGTIPPTRQGWADFLAAARRQKQLRFGDLASVTAVWWRRPMPTGVIGADLGGVSEEEEE